MVFWLITALSTCVAVVNLAQMFFEIKFNRTQ